MTFRSLPGTMRGTALVNVVLILHVSRTTKITVTLFTIISTYPPPWQQNNREARRTALQPIRLITGRVVAGRDCIKYFLKYSDKFLRV